MNEVDQQLTRFVAERYLFDKNAVVEPSTALFSTQVIDSFGVMELILKIEDLYGVHLEIPQLVERAVDTYADLLSLIHDSKNAA